MAGIEIKGIQLISDRFRTVVNDCPNLRRQLHNKIADVIKQEVDASIARSVNDASGHVRSWQERVVGSGGGYAAVRPISVDTGRNSPGAITGYIERGHRIRPSNPKRKPRIKVAYVNGRWFYRSAKSPAQAKAVKIAEDFAADLASRIEG